jgi:predicted helicase
LGTKEAKASHAIESSVIFRTYSGGVKTNRDNWVYDFDRGQLEEKMKRFIDAYNADVDRWRRRGHNTTSLDNFVTYDDRSIKWSEHLKLQLAGGRYISYYGQRIRHSLYRPFTKQYLYFDHMVNDRQLLQHLFLPTPESELENTIICVSGLGDRQGFGCLATNLIASFDLAFEKAQSFPYYTYAENGSRRENITDWALAQFQAKYGLEVTKWDIFHYIYAMLHHPQYRERYAENLKRDLPHIPLLYRKKAFLDCVRIGRQLMDMHLGYEQAKEYPLKRIENRDVPFSWRVEKMRLTPDKTAVIVNESLTLSGIPQECFQYRLGNRSALDWVIDQYQVSKDKRSGIVSDPNNMDDEEYIVRLVGKVVTVSLETVKLVRELEQAVTQEDWMSEIKEAH